MEWIGPQVPLLTWVNWPIGREGVVKMGDGGDVPGVTDHGTCPEGAGVVNEVRDNRIHEFLREVGDW